MDKHSQAHGKVLRSEFTPSAWAKNRHVQTIWPRFFQRRQPLTFTEQRVETPDNDFVDLAWSAEPEPCKGIVVIFHGLEGSIRSHYANDIMAFLYTQGWRVVLMHFRGCSGSVNNTTKTYHSGDTLDATFILERLRAQFGEQLMIGLGFSLGGNVLLKLLGEQPKQKWLQAACVVSAPLKLAECASSMQQGFSRVYQRYLLASMKRTLLKKMQRIDYSRVLPITEAHVKDITSFRQFDELVTAPLHGFEDAVDYYEKCSGFYFLSAIRTPTLVLHAKDDPFMNEQVIPEPSDLSSSVTVELSEYGGHVGFMQGTPWRPVIWFHQRVASYLDQQREAHS
ncbi:hydrolase [Alteromonas oceanisediminis]|uniref:hydrolase n=1 Tax=Alteromonas oceanisediminis TaxID=2836180 RepID=UPI001BDB6983|nr:hydrolase [Alteromonas oceanisediminis]